MTLQAWMAKPRERMVGGEGGGADSSEVVCRSYHGIGTDALFPLFCRFCELIPFVLFTYTQSERRKRFFFVVFFHRWVQVIIIIGSRINRAVHSTKIEKVQILPPTCHRARGKRKAWRRGRTRGERKALGSANEGQSKTRMSDGGGGKKAPGMHIHAAAGGGRGWAGEATPPPV